MSTNRPWFYPDVVSVAPGETVRIFASAPTSPCTLTVSRMGKESVEVARFEEIAVGDHPTPDNADTNGCNWPEAFEFEVGADWQSGYYDLALTGPDGDTTHHFICVRPAKNGPRAKAVMVLSTNTYMAYNYWGGSNSYADVEALVAGKVSPEDSQQGAIGRLSRMRPYPQGLIAPPDGAPRLINVTVRGPGEMPLPGDPAWAINPCG